jgi:hypothetical protein
MTTLVLLRLRFKLTLHGRRETLLLVEEANALAFGPQGVAAHGDEARDLLEAQASGNLAPVARERLLTQARERIAALQATEIADFARARAKILAEDHARVRSAGVAVSRVSVEAVLPTDVIGLFVLIPAGV